MIQYLSLMRNILNNGSRRNGRNGGTLSVFGTQMEFDLNRGFPLVTTRKIFTKGLIHELLWIISGSTNAKSLSQYGVHIWDAWADENGDLGPVYGKQWRDWGGVDQLSVVIDQIRNNPNSRRILVSSWNVPELPLMALPPCHCLFQFYVSDGYLSCKLYQRSADVFIGLPYNIASYALLVHMIAQQCGLSPGRFIWTGGDCHLYLNHLDQAGEQLERVPRELPDLVIKRNPPSVFDYRYGDFKIRGYNPYPHIKGEVSI